MTDTARTLADIKARLASNVTAGISAQTMRDVVESIVHPVSGGGFDNGIACLFSIDASMTPVPNNTYVPYTVYAPADPSNTHRYDPLGILQTGSSYVSTFDGVTHAAGSWWAIPAGLWLIKMQVVWVTSTSVGTRYIDARAIDNRQDTPELDHLFWNPGYQGSINLGQDNIQSGAAVNANGYAGGLHSVAIMARVLPGLAPVAFGASIFQDSGASLALTSGHVIIQRVGL